MFKTQNTKHKTQNTKLKTQQSPAASQPPLHSAQSMVPPQIIPHIAPLSSPASPHYVALPSNSLRLRCVIFKSVGSCRGDRSRARPSVRAGRAHQEQRCAYPGGHSSLLPAQRSVRYAVCSATTGYRRIRRYTVNEVCPDEMGLCV